ncbi:IS66 family transposase [Amycolatopsis mongoliensis]|uniref:IS66 family transposase n=1 Tax=Amycolatopsis mongoliensis TaxID=715475 RepID=A0A9Y2JLA3_9PSEU|nr:IS66 family transposase [Amycolatopsis sp. 4-36]WIY00590.1 IS66 family transposase [Amycolatopsis sp. 4-36]WIY03175.1 IS66 family transposase [Amycolatopsis sp. 4-36]
MGEGVRPSYDELAALVAAQAVELAHAREEIAALRAEVAALKRRLGTNSGNSSMPPSSDRFAKPAPKSLRSRTGRKQGKQPGAPGANLSLVENPDRIVEHAPSACSGCGAGLRRTDRAGVMRRQVVDLPEVRPSVTEHRLQRLRCRGCHQVTTAPAPAEATAPACYGPNVTALAVYLLTFQHIPVARTAQLLADLMGLPVSTGWVAGVLTPVAANLEGFAEQVEQALRAAPVAHFDETGIRVDGKNWWLHVACTPHLTAYMPHRQRGGEAMDEFGILNYFRGVAVHDGLMSYQDFGRKHARCNAHHLRELVAAGEAHPEHTWPTIAIKTLEALNTAAHAARDDGLDAIPAHIVDPLISRFVRTIHLGLLLHPPSRHRKQSKTRNLLVRLRDYQHQVLLFARDLTVPFTNNQAERDLRMIKAQLKISGGWRTQHGAQVWLRVRGYISTARKNGLHIITALRDAVTGNPWLPTTIEMT